MRTRIKVEFIVEHSGDRMLGSFNINDFIEGGLKAVGVGLGRTLHGTSVNEIEGGAKLALSVVRPAKARR